MLVYAVGIIIRTAVNVPSGFTQVWSTTSSSDTTSEMSQEIFASTGATGTIHGTHNGGANYIVRAPSELQPHLEVVSRLLPTKTTPPTPTPTPPERRISLRAAAPG